MASKKKTSEIREQINQIYEENELAGLISSKSRARSVTVGTTFGGSLEISLRGDYYNLWAVLQPVEVVELIEQMASGVGLQVAMRPRQDFASWRGWDLQAEDRYWAGAASPWQIQEVMEHHKNSLKESKKALKSLPSKKNSKKNGIVPGSKEDLKKTFKEMKIQEEINEDLTKDACKNIEKLREDVLDDIEDRHIENAKLDAMRLIDREMDPDEVWEMANDHIENSIKRKK